MYKHLIYISNPYSSAVVESQVYQLLEYFNNINVFNEITLIQIYSNQNNFEKTRPVLEKYTFTKVYIKGKVGFFSKFNPLNNKIKRQLKKLINGNQFIIHTRTEIIGYYTINALKKLNLPLNLLIDVRGTTLEEIAFRISKDNKTLFLKTQKFLYRNIEKTISANRQILLSAVSPGLKNYLLNQKYFENPIVIHPNIANQSFDFDIEERNHIRKKLGIKANQITIVISTSGGEIWQNDKQIIKEIIDNEHFFILNLSANKIEGKNIVNMVVPFNEMPGLLSAADIGLVWRDKHILNTCASPSKFSEFAVMGLYIIHNDTVKLISDYIRINNAGKITKSIINLDLNLTEVLDVKKRLERIKHGKDNFGISNLAKSYINCYHSIKDE